MKVLQANSFRVEELELDPDKPTILLVTDSPGVHTGLAKICRNVWIPLYETGKYNIVQLAWWHRNPMEQVPWMLLYTIRNSHGILDPQDKYGNVSLNHLLGQFKPDLVWASGDPWMITPLTARRQLIPGPIISYLAVDGGPLDPGGPTTNTVGWYEVCSNSDVVVPYLPWGQDLMDAVFPDAHVTAPIPVGIDTKIFKPLTVEERAEARKIYFRSVPDGAGLFTSVSRNQFRKNLPENIRALYFLRSGKYGVCTKCGRYNLWRRDYVRCKDLGPEPCCKFCRGDLRNGTIRPELTYYMHVPLDEAMDDSWRIPDLLNQFGIITEDKLQGVLVNDALASTHGVSDPDLAGYLACCDAYAMPSMGEGFGMPYLEALACGVPVVATDYSAHPDYLKGVGRLVPCTHVSCEPATNYWRGLVDPDAWAQALDEVIFGNEGDRQACRARALEYDWQNIWPQWEILIDKCLHEGRSIGVWNQQLQGV
jgi:glycosyltransferase involved in cell wall biosynthesis